MNEHQHENQQHEEEEEEEDEILSYACLNVYAAMLCYAMLIRMRRGIWKQCKQAVLVG